MENDSNIDLASFISDDTNVEPQVAQPTVNDPLLSDLDALFGKEAGVGDQDGVKKIDKQKVTFSDDDPFAHKNQPRDPEKLLAQLQSDRDKARAEVTRVTADLQKAKVYEDFLGTLQDDQEMRHAFIAQLEPDLVKPKDPLTFIQERLKKEFPGFTPDTDEINIVGSPTWTYNQRGTDLFQEWKKTNGTPPPTLVELKAKRKAARDAANVAAQRDKQETMQKLNWGDQDWDSFVDWVTKVKTIHMATIRDGIVKQAMKKGNPPSVVSQSGGKVNTPSGYMTELDNLFGKGPNNF